MYADPFGRTSSPSADYLDSNASPNDTLQKAPAALGVEPISGEAHSNVSFDHSDNAFYIHVVRALIMLAADPAPAVSRKAAAGLLLVNCSAKGIPLDTRPSSIHFGVSDSCDGGHLSVGVTYR